ncbi:hypothetical protein FraEuI1c_2152 [Pseudofrankia inefficax]|uniref:Uncharacterized protein n=1 Tax=Pseudofrankia inefficax (strain DSM 45817 / CECT 9037 / DDB 130130 / EuI1c) TaxID=298654 RepID=E3IXN2_PSEI1|nr:hypothetical protein FraEuI1c_2152 [Pseudofrankia inefficax]
MTMLASCAGGAQPAGQAATTTPAAAAATTVPAGTTPTKARSGAAVVATRLINLAPVDQRGHATSGWSIDRNDDDPNAPIDCGDTSQAYPSPAAASGDIYSCAPSAAEADACWPTAQARQMLCLRDPYSPVLTALTAQALVAKVSAPRDPVPLGLRLANGDQCRLRDGGAWGSPPQHPDYVGYYSCASHGIVWAPQESSTGGIDRTTKRWTVLVGGETGPLTTVAVTDASFVTTAA